MKTEIPESGQALPEADAEPRSWLETAGPGLLVPLGGALLGLGALKIAQGGAASRPALAAVFLVAGVAAGLLPFRYGLPIAVVLAGFEGFVLDFVGDRASYWNEIFAALIVGRSLIRRRPARWELITVGAIGVVFAAYLATGTSLKADAWGAKVLLLSVVVGWAIARLRPGRREWVGVYYGLGAVAVASLVLEAWQRTQGVERLSKLGLVYGERIREITNGGALRAFGGFTSAAPLSYALAITIAAWAGFALGTSRDRRLALNTIWVLPVAAVGLYLTIDRTAVLALLVALIVVAATTRRAILIPAAVLGVIAIVVATSLGSTAPFHHQLGSAAKARLSLWGEYLGDFRPFGRGPGTAGSAYNKVKPSNWRVPLRVPALWNVRYEGISIRGEQAPFVGTYLDRLPPLVLSAQARSIGAPSRLTFALDGKGLLDRTIPTVQAVPIVVRVPSRPTKEEALQVEVSSPPAAVRRTRVSPQPTYAGRPVNLVENPSFEQGTQSWYEYEGKGKGAKISRSPRDPRFGAASLQVAGADGARAGHQGATYAAYAVTAGKRYTLSVYLRGAHGGESVLFTIQDARFVRAINTEGFPLSTSWKRYAYTWRAWKTDSNMQFWARSANQAGAQTFFIDGFQIEQGNHATAYCDGSVDHCHWSGTPHGSPSYRAASTRLTAGVGGARPGAIETIRIASGWLPMPQKPPFLIAIESEVMNVTAVANLTGYRVRRAVRGTRAAPHASGAVVWADDGHLSRSRNPFRFRLPPPGRTSAPVGEPTVELQELRVAGLPLPRTPAERIWERWFERTPAALQSDGPGLVDNLYVAWIWQYGILGFPICIAWLAFLLWPTVFRRREPAAITAALAGVFLIVGAAAVNIWEEAPTDLLAALVLAHAYGATRRSGVRSPS